MTYELGEILPDTSGVKRPYVHVSQIIVLSTPGFYYLHRRGPKAGKVEYIEVDRTYILDLCKAYKVFCENGYTAPVIREHTPNGERLGDVLSLEPWIDPEDKLLKVLARVGWNAKQAPQKIEDKEWRYTSPRLGPLPTDEQGRTFKNVLLELSLTSAPHQKSIDAHRGTHILNGETPDMPTPEERLDALETQLGDIKTMMGDIKTMMEKPKDDKEDPAPPDPPKEEEDAEVEMGEGTNSTPPPVDAATAARLATLEEAHAKLLSEHNAALFAKQFPAGQTLELREGDVSAWQTIYEKAPEAFKQLQGAFAQSDPSKAPEPPKPKPSRYSNIPWGVQLGEGDNASPVHKTLDPVVLLSECTAQFPNDPAKAHEELKRRMSVSA